MKKIAIIMGSTSDYEAMKKACEVLDTFAIPYEKKVVSAHRTPELMFDFAKTAKDNGFSVIIAGAGGAAHLPGMVASMTVLPVIGVPVQSRALNGLDSLLSIVQMPFGVPVATVGINQSGNAALLAIKMLAIEDEMLTRKLEKFMENQKESVLKSEL
ncbi:MAG: 5-(carboxyamino)imidazole ribonucleotide mutase [Clostridia bacterium]